MLGCKNINDKPLNINHNTIITDRNNKEVSFYEYLVTSKKLLCSYIEQAKLMQERNEKISDNKFLNMIDSILYYIGAASVYKKFCDYDIDTIMDLTELSDYWECDINKVLNMYCDNDIKNIDKGMIGESANIMSSDLPQKAREKGILNQSTKRKF